MKRFSILILTLCLCLTGCGKQTTEATAQIFAMDTVMEVAAYCSKAEEAVQETKGRIKALENQLSRTKADSDVSRVNHNGTTPTTGLTYGMRALLPAALEYRDATNGAFDITIAPIMDAWGFTGDQFRVPEQSELNELLKHVNSDEIQVQEEPSYSVTLGEGQAIDLGGIAKGYTSDLVEQTFRANGVESGKISLGGNVFVLGTKPDGSDWRVGIKDPRNESGLAAILSLRDAYAITSGGYERYFEENGKTYHHIIDPATGYPAGNGLLSVSSAQTISAYPELYATTPAWTAWVDVITPVLAGAWLLVYGWRALTGFGGRRQKLGSALPGLVLPLAFLWRLVWRFQFVPASLGRIPCTLRVLSAVAALLFACVLLKVFLTPGLPCGHTLFAAGAGCFLLCTCIELPQTLFEAFNGMLTMPDLLTGLAMGVFGLCGLACTWAAAGEETE